MTKYPDLILRIFTVNNGKNTLLSNVFCPKDDLSSLKTSNNRLLKKFNMLSNRNQPP